MKIIYLGQKGIPAVNQGDKTGRERRTEALATLLAAKGHNVYVSCAKPYVSSNLTKFNEVKLIHRPSFWPDQPGGLLYHFLSLLAIWTKKPDVVHYQGWTAAFLAPLAIILQPEATYIWTIDAWPTKYTSLVRIITRQIEGLFDCITTPSRELQHRLLYNFNIAVTYIPDGYTPDSLPPLPLSQFGLRANTAGYTLTTAQNTKDIRLIAKAYKQAGGRRKMVVLATEQGQLKRLKREYKFLHFVGQQSGRRFHSLLAQAGLIIFSGDNITIDTILSAMHNSKATIATSEIGWPEVLGVTAPIAKKEDTDGLAQIITPLIKDEKANQAGGRQAHKRAQAHFTWQRILPEYIELYHYPTLQTVSLDSAVAIKAQVT